MYLLQEKFLECACFSQTRFFPAFRSWKFVETDCALSKKKQRIEGERHRTFSGVGERDRIESSRNEIVSDISRVRGVNGCLGQGLK